MPYTEQMSVAEYMRFIEYQHHLIQTIRRILRELDVAEFVVFPIDFDHLLRMHDDVQRLRRCPYALHQWRLVRNAAF
jgi:hypothetical protein